MFHSNIIMYLQYINIGITWLANYGCEAYMSNICKSLFAAVYNFNSTGSVTHALACKLGNSLGLWYAHLLDTLSLVPLLQLNYFSIIRQKPVRYTRIFLLLWSKSTQTKGLKVGSVKILSEIFCSCPSHHSFGLESAN